MADDIALIAHLMRRAGFGATRTELEAYAAKGYDATVDELLNPEEHGRERADEQMLIRLQPGALLPGGQPPMGNVNWMFHLVNTERPLEEKNGPVLAPRFCHGQLQGGQLRSTSSSDCPVPRYGYG
jgi:hypothetical protein